jgi:phenylacetic acid degradation protein PaaD
MDTKQNAAGIDAGPRARAAADALLAGDNASRALGIELLDVTLGCARVAMTVRDDMVNGHGICHGGVLFTLADSAFAVACNSYGDPMVAAGAGIEFLAPAPRGARGLECGDRRRLKESANAIAKLYVWAVAGGRRPRRRHARRVHRRGSFIPCRSGPARPATIRPSTSTAESGRCSRSQARVRGTCPTAGSVWTVRWKGVLPEGALQLVCGSLGDLFDHLDCQDTVSFTGSAETAARLRVHPNLLRHAVRFVAEADSLPLLDDVVAALRTALGKITVGDPRAEGVLMGPLVSLDQRRDVSNRVAQLRSDSELVAGSFDSIELLDADHERGAFLPPLLLLCRDPHAARAVHDVEAFGPGLREGVDRAWFAAGAVGSRRPRARRRRRGNGRHPRGAALYAAHRGARIAAGSHRDRRPLDPRQPASRSRSASIPYSLR